MGVYYIQLFIIILNVIVVTSDTKDKSKTPEALIKEHILCDYDKTIRPVIDNKPTKITFAFVTKKVDYSESNGYGTIGGIFVLQWSDDHLSWDPKDFDNHNKITVTSDEIWTPDLSVFNKAVYGSRKLIDSDTKCDVFSSKKVECISDSSIRGMCTPDLRHWPYDVQKCTIKIGSWYHAGSEIHYKDTINAMTVSSFDQNGEWLLKSIDINIDAGIYKGFKNETFPSIKIQFVIQRNNASRFLTTMTPFLVVVAITLITLLLDPRTSERIHFCVFNIPCHILLLIDNAWMVPEYGPIVPYLLIYLRDSNLLASLILIETMVIRYLFNKQDTSPAWLVTIVTKVTNNYVGKILLYKEINTNIDEITASDDDGTLVEIKGKSSDWFLLGRIIDTLFLIVSIIWFAISFLICIT